MRTTFILLFSSIIILVAVSAAIHAALPLPPMKPFSLVVYDRNGVMLNTFRTSDGMWRIRTRPEEIPAGLKQIVLWKEDRYFYLHPGINPFSALRAFAQNIAAGRRVSGASTITMQVARMMEPKQRSYGNKILEVFRAFQLEWRYSKEEILALYLSMIPLGGNIEGLQTGAMMYYRTPLQRLNIAQTLDLILIPNDPNGLRPDRNSDLLFRKRSAMARQLLISGILSDQDIAVADSSRSAAVRTALPKLAPHFSLVLKQLFPKEDQITGSLDLTTQRAAERLLKNHMRSWKQRGVNNGAVMIIDNATSEVTAYVGSENFADTAHGSQVDAVRAVRSPGSTLKPFLYAMRMDGGTLTPKSRLTDVPFDNEGYVAENFDRSFSGMVYADAALRRSLNVPMVYLLRESGMEDLLHLLNAAGITSLQTQQTRLGLSMILGGCGVTLEELTRAFTIFPSGGVFRMPSYRRHDSRNSAVRSNVISPSSAYMVTEILSGIDRPDLPNNFESSKNLPTVAFKTGTSYGKRDAWCIGYSSRYTVGVWIGNVTNKGNPELKGSTSATPLLIDLFNSISRPSDRSNTKMILPVPDDIGIREVCAVSGKIPTDLCGERIDDLYSRTHSLNTLCDVHKEYKVSLNGSIQYCGSCLPSADYSVRIYEELPPVVVNFLKRSGRPIDIPPAHNPLCLRTFSGTGPTIISPSEQMTYLIVDNGQKITFHATSGVDVSSHEWYLNRRYLGRKKAGESVFLTVGEGAYAARCVDDKGRSSVIHFNVKKAL